MTIHPTLTPQRILNAAEADDYIGLCVACGAERYNCEPDARQYLCHECHDFTVYGAEELLVMTQ